MPVGHFLEGSAWSPADGKCVWGCGGRDFNREHIIGQQIAKALGIKGEVTTRWGPHRYANTKKLEIVVEGRVCKRCNNGWMRKLDNRMMCFMRDTIAQAKPVSLTTTRQLTLAYWATKVALLNEVFLLDEASKRQLSDVGRFFAPEDNLQAVWKYNRPPKLTRVWLGARTQAPEPFLIHGSSLLVPEEDPAQASAYVEWMGHQRERGYSSLFTVRHLVFVVRGWELAYSASADDLQDPNDLVPGSMLPIWPTSDTPVAWPPARTLSPDDIGKITGTPPEWVE